MSQSKSQALPPVEKEPPETEFYLLGWGVPTFDSDYVFCFLYHSRTGRMGTWNGTRYANADLDKMIESLIGRDRHGQAQCHDRRDLEASLQDEMIYLPVHHQMLAYAMKKESGFSGVAGQRRAT